MIWQKKERIVHKIKRSIDNNVWLFFFLQRSRDIFGHGKRKEWLDIRDEYMYITGSDDKSVMQSSYLQNSAWCLLYPSPSPLELSEECLLLCFWPNILWIISAMLNVQVIPELERKEEKNPEH